ncbi:MAG: IS4 family transposase [Oscillochloris sp.]|nr:IS4 family transposase [Oscillochloris sp.]
MSSIPQVATAMEHVLTTVARQAARATGFIQRQRAFDGAQFVQTLVFGWLHNPQATTDDLVAMAADLGVTISAQGLADRFSDAAVACLEQVLQAAIAQVIAADPLTIPLLERFPEVVLHDSTTISLPDALASWFRGCGGSHGQVAAALKAHLRLELRTGQVEGPLFQDGRAHDRAVAFRRHPPLGALTLRDLGFFQLDDLAADQRDGRHWRSYLKPNTAVFHAGQRLDLATFLPLQGGGVIDLAVMVGVRQRVPCRLLAVPVPEDVAEQRRERIQKEARDKGTRVRPERLVLCGWTIIITMLEADQLR